MIIACASRRSSSIGTRVARAFTVSLVAILTSLGAAGAASAAASDCPSGYACIWGDQNYLTRGAGGAYVPFYECHHNFALSTFAGTGINADNKATSVTNRGNINSASFYRDTYYGGAAFTLAKGTGDGHLNDSTGNAPGGFDDALSSGKFSGVGTGCR